jgi:hypothetical protein
MGYEISCFCDKEKLINTKNAAITGDFGLG